MRKLLIEKYNSPSVIIDGICVMWGNADREIHRENNLPAVINWNGVLEYFKNGKRYKVEEIPANDAVAYMRHIIDNGHFDDDCVLRNLYFFG